jgi:hypothetical protein
MFPAIKQNPIDWPAVVNDLVRGGYSIPAIHARIGIPESTIKGWRNVGAKPCHDKGELIIDLWCNATLRDRSQIPRTNRPPPKPAALRRSSWIQLPLLE